MPTNYTSNSSQQKKRFFEGHDLDVEYLTQFHQHPEIVQNTPKRFCTQAGRHGQSHEQSENYVFFPTQHQIQNQTDMHSNTHFEMSLQPQPQPQPQLQYQAQPQTEMQMQDSIESTTQTSHIIPSSSLYSSFRSEPSYNFNPNSYPNSSCHPNSDSNTNMTHNACPPSNLDTSPSNSNTILSSSPRMYFYLPLEDILEF